MNYANKMFLESIKLDFKYLESDNMNFYPPSKLRKITGNEAFEDYVKRLAEMKSGMPRFLDPNELNGEARYIWIRIKECYKNREKYERRKKENKKVERAIGHEEEKASGLYEALEDDDRRPFFQDEKIRLKYSRACVDFELPVAMDLGHGMWEIEQVKNMCQREFISSKIDELECQIAGPQGHSQMQGGLDLARSKIKELRTLFR